MQHFEKVTHLIHSDVFNLNIRIINHQFMQLFRIDCFFNKEGHILGVHRNTVKRAGFSTEMESEVVFGPLTNAVHCWILDYYCHCTLQEWSEKFEPSSNKYVQAANFLANFSEEMIISKALQFKLELISWLPRLYSLHKERKIDAYTEIFKEISATHSICPDSLGNITKKFFCQLRKQCILLCCQKIGFPAASEVYKSLDDKLDKKSERELTEILDTENLDHNAFQCYIPSSINTSVCQYLQNHLLPLTTPFLITAAAEALNKNDDDGLMSPIQKRESMQPDMIVQLAKTFNEDPSKSSLVLDNSEQEAYSNKLKFIWNENHMKYHKKLEKFEKEIFSLPDDKEINSDQMMSTRKRRRPRIFTVSPVEKTFPEVEKITLCPNLKPPVTKKNIRMCRVPWTQEQEEEFYLAVKKIGFGNWAEIRDYISFQKTNINLKDKWRQFYRSGKIKWLAEKFGKV